MRTTICSLLLLVAMLAGCFGEDGGEAGDADDGDTEQGDPRDEIDPGANDNDDPPPEDNGTAPENETPAPRDPVTWTIVIEDNRFVEGTITVQQGDTVRWEHEGNAPHTVTSNGGTELDSGTMTHFTNNPWSHTFETVGEFPYFCEFHPSMTGTITVLEVYLEEP